MKELPTQEFPRGANFAARSVENVLDRAFLVLLQHLDRETVILVRELERHAAHHVHRALRIQIAGRVDEKKRRAFLRRLERFSFEAFSTSSLSRSSQSASS